MVPVNVRVVDIVDDPVPVKIPLGTPLSKTGIDQLSPLIAITDISIVLLAVFVPLFT